MVYAWFGFSLTRQVFVAPHYDNDSERLYTNYALRVGEVEPSFPASKYIDREKQVVAVGMRGQLTYQKSRWFDPGRQSLFETLEWIETAKNDLAIGGIVLNMSGFNSSTELAWELTEKLKDLRRTGKKVYMYVDRPGMTQMYIMSQADYVWMDPVGDINIFGWVMGRTYYKGMFEKLGLGVEEWRYFEYKSAFESLARTNMSEKDREQRQALLDEFNAAWLKGISEGLGVNSDSVMLAVDSLGMVSAHEAYLFGLVDSLGRWDDAPELIEVWNGQRPEIIERQEMVESEFVDPRWGEYPKIALVYALGECALDTGIRGRYTSKLLRRLAKNKNIEAVVLRVDSPGGDGLASDWVAEQMRVVSDEKPMIVSQGRLAASGGYWISSPADRIFTSPFTITGSIGVIAGWIWNDGLTDKTGLTFDKVMVGKHADLGSGVILPLIGAEIPDRP
ncbi:MAG: S49 family peptidase [bacterium]|nr:S49 family peptidase [bacterium]